MLSILRIRGDSMRPDLIPGDYVIILRCFWPLRRGVKVVVKHPDYGIIIKRVKHRGSCGRYKLIGDNREVSVSSEKLGWVAAKHILGRVIFTIRQ